MAPRRQDDHLVLARFGDRLRDLRLARGVSQSDLAHRAGLHPTYVSGIERGLRNVGLVNLVHIARALEVAPSDLLRSID